MSRARNIHWSLHYIWISMMTRRLIHASRSSASRVIHRISNSISNIQWYFVVCLALSYARVSRCIARYTWTAAAVEFLILIQRPMMQFALIKLAMKWWLLRHCITVLLLCVLCACGTRGDRSGQCEVVADAGGGANSKAAGDSYICRRWLP